MLDEMVKPTEDEERHAEKEMMKAEAPPLPTMADIAPEGFVDAPEMVTE